MRICRSSCIASAQCSRNLAKRTWLNGCHGSATSRSRIDRIGLRKARVWSIRDRDVADPWQPFSQVLFAKFLDDCAEAMHEERQILMNRLKAPCQEIRFHCVRALEYLSRTTRRCQ